MKKFNTILAIAAVALTSVLGLSSCDKNDDSFNEPIQPVSAPTVYTDAYLCVPVLGDQMEYLDATYTVTVDGKNMQIKQSDMTEIKDATRLKLACNGKDLVDAFNDIDDNIKNDKCAMYEYHLGKAASVKLNSVVYSSKGKLVDEQHEIDLVAGYKFISSSWDSKSTYRYFKGINELEGFCTVLNQYFK